MFLNALVSDQDWVFDYKVQLSDSLSLSPTLTLTLTDTYMQI